MGTVSERLHACVCVYSTTINHHGLKGVGAELLLAAALTDMSTTLKTKFRCKRLAYKDVREIIKGEINASFLQVTHAGAGFQLSAMSFCAATDPALSCEAQGTKLQCSDMQPPLRAGGQLHPSESPSSDCPPKHYSLEALPPPWWSRVWGAYSHLHTNTCARCPCMAMLRWAGSAKTVRDGEGDGLAGSPSHSAGPKHVFSGAKHTAHTPAEEGHRVNPQCTSHALCRRGRGPLLGQIIAMCRGKLTTRFWTFKITK